MLKCINYWIKWEILKTLQLFSCSETFLFDKSLKYFNNFQHWAIYVVSKLIIKINVEFASSLLFVSVQDNILKAKIANDFLLSRNHRLKINQFCLTKLKIFLIYDLRFLLKRKSLSILAFIMDFKFIFKKQLKQCKN